VRGILLPDSHRDPTYDVLLQGRAFCDLTFSFSELRGLPELGHEVFADDFAMSAGGIFNIASALTALGRRVGWLTELGNDIFSRFVAGQMEACGISTDLTRTLERPLPVVTAGISFPHDRVFVSYISPQVDDSQKWALTPGHLDLFRPRVLFTYGEVGAGLMREARERGILVYLDTFWNPQHLRSAAMREMFGHIDVLAPNQLEAMEITGTANPHEALEALAQVSPRGAIKCGAAGSIAWQGSERFLVPAIPVEAVETTGAGDNFNAGLIYGLLKGFDFQTCLRCASVTGGLSTLGLGGCVKRLTEAELQEWMNRMDWNGRP
jgi:sugar/nucleoside kinase (ribokinase family)